MNLLPVASAAHLGGSVVLALFFLLLARHEPRPYLRDWTAAWVAQAVALGMFFGANALDGPFSIHLYLLLLAVHGLLLVAAAWAFAHEPLPLGQRLAALGVVAAWSWVAPRLLAEEARLEVAQLTLLAGLSLAAAAILWRAREPGAMGVRLSSHAFGLLALVQALEALLVGIADPGTARAQVFLEIAPFVVLFLQMLLGMALVLSAMERTARDLASANAQLHQAQRQLQVLADTDPLTGCANRRVFRELVDRLRAAGMQGGAVLLLDMDGLKAINDLEGHAAGDDAIRRLAAAVRAHTRTTDLVVRWGGDEFVVVLPGAAVDDALERRDAIVQAIAAERLSASVGVAHYGPERDVVDAVHDADQEMYRAKAARKARTA